MLRVSDEKLCMRSKLIYRQKEREGIGSYVALQVTPHMVDAFDRVTSIVGMHPTVVYLYARGLGPHADASIQ